MGRYLNHTDQGERIRQVLQIERLGSFEAIVRTPKRVFRRLEASSVAELVQGYENGVPVNDLATQFELHRSTVLEHLNRAAPKRRYPALDRDQVGDAACLYQAGNSLRGIGILFGVHASTVGQYLKKAGVIIRDSRGQDGSQLG